MSGFRMVGFSHKHFFSLYIKGSRLVDHSKTGHAFCPVFRWFRYSGVQFSDGNCINIFSADNFDFTFFGRLEISEVDLIPGFATFFACLFWALEYGILIGVGVQILFVLYNIARPSVKVYTKRVGFFILFLTKLLGKGSIIMLTAVR